MNNFREGLNALREISDPEKMKMALEKITGKKLADYEGIDALVGALMGYYNDEVKKKLTQGTVPNSLNSAEKIVAALQGNGGLKFDESLLYLNDAGTKKKGFYYLDKLKNGIFECLEQTTATVNDSSKFKDISNKSNSDRLDNLGECKIDTVEFKTGESMKERTLRLPKGLFMSYTNAYTVPSDLPSELKNLHSWVMCTTLGRPMIMIIASTGIIYTATAVGGNEQWVFSDFIKS